jgi:hypothetical protein
MNEDTMKTDLSKIDLASVMHTLKGVEPGDSVVVLVHGPGGDYTFTRASCEHLAFMAGLLLTHAVGDMTDEEYEGEPDLDPETGLLHCFLRDDIPVPWDHIKPEILCLYAADLVNHAAGRMRPDAEQADVGRGWPDPSEPGVPAGALEDGFHWMRWPSTGVLTVGQWCADNRAWVTCYLGTAALPEQLAHLDYAGRITPP